MTLEVEKICVKLPIALFLFCSCSLCITFNEQVAKVFNHYCILLSDAQGFLLAALVIRESTFLFCSFDYNDPSFLAPARVFSALFYSIFNMLSFFLLIFSMTFTMVFNSLRMTLPDLFSEFLAIIWELMLASAIHHLDLLHLIHLMILHWMV